MICTRTYSIIKEGKKKGIVIFNSKEDKSSYIAKIILKDLQHGLQKSDVISEGRIIEGKPFKLVRSQAENELKQLFGDGVSMVLKK